MYPGCIIAFTMGKECGFGQVVYCTVGELCVKRLFSDEFLDIHNWMEGIEKNNPAVRPAFCNRPEKNMIELTKTVVVLQGIGCHRPPTRWQRFFVWMAGGAYKCRCARRSGFPYWQRVFRVKGTLYADGIFIPHGSEPIQRPQYFEQYNKLRLWKSIMDNRPLTN